MLKNYIILQYNTLGFELFKITKALFEGLLCNAGMFTHTHGQKHKSTLVLKEAERDFSICFFISPEPHLAFS